MSTPRHALIALLFAVTFSVACGGVQRRGPDYAFDGPAQDAVDLWFQGDEPKAESTALAAGDSTPALFTAAEVSYWRGDAERAFELYLEIVRDHTGHDLARLAAARVFGMRGTVMRWDDRVLEALKEADWEGSQPLTRLYLAMSGESARQRVWRRSDTTEPFDAIAVGFPNMWRTTPLLSPWRLTDFDTRFDAETAPIADDYVSPVVAADDPRNREMSEIYVSQGTANYPQFSRSGVYLLESFVTADETRDFWFFGQFVGQAEVFIDGERVFRRDEGNYDSPKLMRRIRLDKGTHRLVVKLGFQRGYRDWFDLAFVPDGPAAYDETGLTVQLGCSKARKLPNCFEGDADGSVTFLGDAHKLAHWETIWLEPKEMKKASDLALYLTMAHAYYSADDAVYQAAWDVLRERRPDFSPGWGLTADWLQTLWQVPSRLRDSRTQQALRRAYELDPDSLYYLEKLGAWLRRKDGEREAKELLKKARDLAIVDGRLRDIGPMNAWASYLDERDWDEEAVAAWREALAAAPANCRAAAALMNDLHIRSVYPDPSEVTEEHERCDELYRIWLGARDELDEERLARVRREALRAPYDVGEQRSLARELERQGKFEEARGTIEQALERMPDSLSLWNALADFQLAHESDEAARATLEEAIEINRRRGWLVWKLARMGGTIPLEEVMPDGLEAAKKEVALGDDIPAGANDDAYFVVDFAARHYFPDLTSITLTHTVVRVMTKDAIDRYGERSLPNDAIPLLVRTIKQDGSVRVPEETAGKSTLSMPGLAEGDFVEVAYLQYGGAQLPRTNVEGVRFYFRMDDISTRLSEYVILGEQADFMRRNDAPEPEAIEIGGVKGVRFVARNNPRPRDEPRSVPGNEFLPWIQMYRRGTTISDTEVVRRNYRESIRESLKMSADLEVKIAEWNAAAVDAGKRGSRAWVEQLFYDVTGHVTQPGGGFSTDVGHALLTKEGNPMMLLKAVYDALDVPNEIYLVKTAFQPDDELPYGEISRYSETVLVVTVPETGDVIWTSANSPDAMMGALPRPVMDRPAICITCDESDVVTTPGPDAFPATEQVTSIDAELGANGTLAGTARLELRGGLAAVFRGVLRSRPDDTARDKLVGQAMAGLIPSSTVTSWELENEKDRRESLTFVVQFMRPNFARETGPGVLTVEERFFREPIASAYTPLPERTTPLFVGSERHNDYRLAIKLPDKKVSVLSQTGERRLESEFGTYVRTLEIGDGELVLSTSLDLSVQRVPVAKYREFQAWAIAVEQSAAFLMTLQ